MATKNNISLKNKFKNYINWYKNFFDLANADESDYEYSSSGLLSEENIKDEYYYFQQHSLRKNIFITNLKKQLSFNVTNNLLKKIDKSSIDIFKKYFNYYDEIKKYSDNELLNNRKNNRSISKDIEHYNFTFLNQYSLLKSHLRKFCKEGDKILIKMEYEYSDFIKLGSNSCDSDSCFSELAYDSSSDKRNIAISDNCFVLNFYLNKIHFGRCFGKMYKNKVCLRNFYNGCSRTRLKTLSYLFFTKILKKELQVCPSQSRVFVQSAYNNGDQISFLFK